MVLDSSGQLHRVADSRLMQVKCKVSAVWQARLANAEPQPSLVLATSLLRLQNYKNIPCKTSLFWIIFQKVLNVKILIDEGNPSSIYAFYARATRLLQSASKNSSFYEIAVFSLITFSIGLFVTNTLLRLYAYTLLHLLSALLQKSLYILFIIIIYYNI